MSKFVSMPRASVSTPVARPMAASAHLQKIWASMPAADRVVILGHSELELSADDQRRLVAILGKLGKQARRG